MKQSLQILIGYLTCTDPIMQTKWNNILNSYWHKDDGVLFDAPTVDAAGNITLNWTTADGSTDSYVIAAFPTSRPVSFIENLQQLLNDKVTATPGKGLSTNDFTTAFKNKLEQLQNYVHPDFHQVSEIEGLLDILGEKVDKEAGKGLSTNDYSDEEKAAVGNIPVNLSDLNNDVGLGDPTSINTVFVDTVDGDDDTAGLQLYSKPFLTEQAAFDAIPDDGNEWTIFFIDGDVTRQITSAFYTKKVFYKTTSAGILDFSNAVYANRFADNNPLKIDAPSVSVIVDKEGDPSFGLSGSLEPFYINVDEITIRGNTILNCLNLTRPSVFKANVFNMDLSLYSTLFRCWIDFDVQTLVAIQGYLLYGTLGVEYQKLCTVKIKNIVVTGSFTLFATSTVSNISVGNITGNGFFRFVTGKVSDFPMVINLINTVIDDTVTVVAFGSSRNVTLSGNNLSDNYNLIVDNLNTYQDVFYKNFSGKVKGEARTTFGKNSVHIVIDNSFIQTDTYLMRRGSPITNATIGDVTFKGFSTVITDDPDNFTEMFPWQSAEDPMPLIDNGTVKTNFKSFGKNINVTNVTSTFKERSNQRTIKSAVDLTNTTLDIIKSHEVDGVLIFDAGEYIYAPDAGEILTLNGYGLENSIIRKNANEPLFIKDPNKTGVGGFNFNNIQFQNPSGSIFDLTFSPFSIIEMSNVNFSDCNSIGSLNGLFQGLGTTIGFYNCMDGLTLDGSCNGFKFFNSNVRNFDAAGTLFKRGANLVYNSDFTVGMKADLQAGAVLADFIPANFPNPKSFQLLDGQYSIDGSTDAVTNTPLLLTGITPKDDCALFRNRKGLLDSFADSLRIKGEDNAYYELFVDATGNIDKRAV